MRTLLTICNLFACLTVGQTSSIAVAGLFQVQETGSDACGLLMYTPSVMAIEAIRWSFRKLAENNDAPVIDLIPYKTCGLEELTTDTTVKILSERSQTPNVFLAGIIGPEFSTEAKRMSDMISSLPVSKHIPQISYSATATVLDDRSTFPNFFRVIPNDDNQVETMIQLMKQLEWNRIALVHDGDLYAEEIVRNLEKRLPPSGICVSTTQNFTKSTGVIRSVLEHILVSKITIKGIVLVGRLETIRLFMLSLEIYSTVEHKPAMIISESVQMQLSAFTNSQNEIFKVSKGSYVVSPDYIQIEQFQNYWTSLFVNQSKLLEENQSNPWLVDVYDQEFNCRPGADTTCPSLSQSDVDAQFAEQPLYIRYAILAAYAMATAINETVSKTCGNNKIVCGELLDESAASKVLAEIDQLDFSVDNRFSFKPDGIKHAQLMVGYQTDERQGQSLYKVYNLRESENQQSQFVLMEVGNYSDGHLNITKERIIDYYDNGDEFRHVWPDIRRAQCPENHVCDECIADNKPDEFVFIEGDLYVIALVANSKSDSKMGCAGFSESNLNGYGNSVAMQKAVQDFNQAGGFGDQKVGLIVFDSCSNPTLSDYRIKNVIKSGIVLKDGTRVEMLDKILGVVASYFSSVSVAISRTLRSFQILHLAYGATSPTLSNREEYPFFMRVATPDDKQADVAVRILKEMDMNYVQLIYSEDAYGKGLRDSFKSKAGSEGICIANTISLSAEDSSKINQIYQNLRSKPFAKMVVIALSTFMNEVLESLTSTMNPDEFVFLGTESWGINTEILKKENSGKLVDSITINLELPDLYGIENVMRNIDKDESFPNPWTTDYLQRTMKCHYSESFDKTFSGLCPSSFQQFWTDTNMTVGNWGPFSYLAVQSLLNGSSQFYRNKCREKGVICEDYRHDVGELINILKRDSRITIQGQTSNVFDTNGDGNTGYVIYRVQKKPGTPLELEYKEIGRYTPDGSFTTKNGFTASVKSTCPNEITCAECLPVVEEVKPQTKTCDGPTTEIALGTVVGVLVLVVVVIAVLLYNSRKKLKTMQTASDGYLTPTEVSTKYNNDSYGEHFDTLDPVAQGQMY